MCDDLVVTSWAVLEAERVLVSCEQLMVNCALGDSFENVVGAAPGFELVPHAWFGRR